MCRLHTQIHDFGTFHSNVHSVNMQAAGRRSFRVTCKSLIMKMLCADVPYLTRPTRTKLEPMLSWSTTPLMKFRTEVQLAHALSLLQIARELSTTKTRFARANEHRLATATTHNTPFQTDKRDISYISLYILDS